MKIKPIAEIIAFLQPIADEVGVELVDAEWNGRDNSLTVFIDSEEGIDLVTCEKFHRAIDGPLDELDPTYGGAYTLNCSSPGLDRPFKRPRDYERHLGEKVEVHLYAPMRGKKYFEGILASYDGTTVTVELPEGETKFPLTQVAKICVAIEFD